ncbi:MAG TPA: alpha amylase C-terminal domain-containing protein, partial [Accumulibacter sp.]|nr:alpha amylase C-terminal domain-containing protein [Accumulibacter sp.]
FVPAGFEWIAADDADCSVVAFVRWSRDRSRAILYVGNFTPVVRYSYRIGVPMPGNYQERLNTDSDAYGGSNVGNGTQCLAAEQVYAHGREWSLNLVLPPLAALYFEWQP